MSKNNQSLTGLALQKFRKNFWGVLSFVFIVLLVLVAVFAYFLSPDKTKNGNWGDLSIHSKPPGFTVKMLTIPQKGSAYETRWQDYFTGRDFTEPKVPVLDYAIIGDSLTYKEYNNDAELAVTKSVPLSVFGS